MAGKIDRRKLPKSIYLVRESIRVRFSREQQLLYKIGRSVDPHTRNWQVAANGELVHYFPSANSSRVEVALHRRFAHCHVRGEWFRLTDADVELIKTVWIADTVEDLPESLRPQPGAKLPSDWSKRHPRIPIVVTEADRRRLDGEAARRGMSVSELVCRALAEMRLIHGRPEWMNQPIWRACGFISEAEDAPDAPSA